MTNLLNPSVQEPVDDGSAARGGGDWKFALMGGLATAKAHRIFTAGDFQEFVQTYRPGASASTARLAAESMVAAGALRRVSSGVFLNRRQTPPAELTEVASNLRAGAVVSLHSVLGECGFLNNPSAVVMAVLPTSANKRPRLGEVTTSTGDIFRFYGLAEKFFPASAEERFLMLQPGRPCETFRPEAALLQWLHLAGMQRSSLTAPPVDVDMAALDADLLDELAGRWRLGPAFGDWLADARRRHFGEEQDRSATPPGEPSQAAQEASAASRARLMERRGRKD